MSPRALRLFIPGFVLLYVAIGYGRWALYLPEVYPVGAFEMFQRVRPYHVEYDLVVHRSAGRELDTPASARRDPTRAGVELDGHRLLVINGYVRRIQEGNPSAELYRRYLDRLVGPDARYDIVRVTVLTRTLRGDRRRSSTVQMFDYPVIAFLGFFLAIYVELVSLPIAFRPRLMRPWFLTLALFHVMTLVTMNIMFEPAVAVLLVLFLFSPFSPPQGDWRESVRDLPIVGHVLGLALGSPKPPELERPEALGRAG